MKIKLYLKEQGLTWEQLADLSGVSRQTVYNIMKKKHKPSLTVIRKIEKATDGMVTLEDMEVTRIIKTV